MSTYSAYYRHNQWLQRDLLSSVQSKLFQMDSDELMNGLCNGKLFLDVPTNEIPTKVSLGIGQRTLQPYA